MHRILTGAFATMLAGALVIVLIGCAPRELSSPTITVEGEVTARGNEPFAAYVLETAARNFYVLTMSDSLRTDFSTPARVRVTGRLYRDTWNDRPFAHIEVHEWERR